MEPYYDSLGFAYVNEKIVEHLCEYKTVEDTLNASFILYAIKRMWADDSCGTKFYRANINRFIVANQNVLCLTESKITLMLGKPDKMFYKGDDTIVYSYTILKDEMCNKVYKEVIFYIDLNKNSVEIFSRSNVWDE